jgi:hypothetical protein
VPGPHSESRRFEGDLQAIREAIGHALASLGATYVVWSQDGSQVNAVLGPGGMSSGATSMARLTIVVGESGEVRVSSECYFPLQLSDYGTNTWACQSILYSISERLSAGQATGVGDSPD